MRQIREIMPLKTSGMPPAGPVMRQKTGSTASAGSGMPRIGLRPPAPPHPSPSPSDQGGKDADALGRKRVPNRCGLKGRENPIRQDSSRGLSGRSPLSSSPPGHRPSASALGSILPTRWVGREASSGRWKLPLTGRKLPQGDMQLFKLESALLPSSHRFGRSRYPLSPIVLNSPPWIT